MGRGGGSEQDSAPQTRGHRRAVGMDGIIMNLGIKPEVGETALKRDFMAFSLFSQAKGT